MDFIEEIKQNVKGRNVVVWGIDSVALKCYYILRYNKINAFLMSDKNKAMPFVKGIKVNGREMLNKHESFIVTTTRVNTVDVLKSKGFEEHIDYILKTSGLMRYDLIFDGVFVGKYTTGIDAFSNSLGLHSGNNIASLGRYCSINNRAYMHGDHNTDLLTTCNRFLKDAGISISGDEKSERDYLAPLNRITIGNDVWIGANAFINASKVKSIGNGAIIGANAVVLEDVPPYAVLVGVPGKVKKYRFTDEQIEILLRVKWWEWDEETVAQNADCFKDINILFKRFG